MLVVGLERYKMEEEKYKLIFVGTFNEGGMKSPEFQEYSQKAGENIAKYGGVVLSKHMIEQNFGHGDTPHIVILVEFPSKEKAIEAVTSDAYKAVVPTRDIALKEVKILLTK